MKYKVINSCFGFRGRYWTAGEVVDLDPSENPPRHFVPLEEVPVEAPRVPHRTEAVEVIPGQQRKVIGGMSVGLEKTKVDRIMTTDKVPIGKEVVKKTPKRRTKKKADAGSVKRSS